MTTELTDGSATGGDIAAACVTGNAAGAFTQNVLRESKDVNENTNMPVGQIGVETTVATDGASSSIWPFIQFYPLNSDKGDVVVQYNPAGNAQSVTLTFDDVDEFAGSSLDRTVYPQGSQIHTTITDSWLNINPTDEDSWTFGTNVDNATSRGAHYQVFDENGASGGAAINIDGTVDSLMCEDNCRLLIDTNAQGAANAVLTIADNDDSILTNLNGISSTVSPNNATNFGRPLA